MIGDPSNDKLLEEIKKIENEKPVKIYLDKQKDQKLIIDLDSGNKEHVTLNDSTYPVNLSDSSISILDEIITGQQARLLKCAIDYRQSGRDMYFFLYDLVSLSASYSDNDAISKAISCRSNGPKYTAVGNTDHGTNRSGWKKIASKITN